MKKKYIYFILLIILLLLVFCFHKEVKKDDKKVTNIGDTLALRVMNLYEIVESGNGLYKIKDKYIFRGNTDNYIKFNDELINEFIKRTCFVVGFTTARIFTSR